MIVVFSKQSTTKIELWNMHKGIIQMIRGTGISSSRFRSVVCPMLPETDGHSWPDRKYKAQNGLFAMSKHVPPLETEYFQKMISCNGLSYKYLFTFLFYNNY